MRRRRTYSDIPYKCICYSRNKEGDAGGEEESNGAAEVGEDEKGIGAEDLVCDCKKIQEGDEFMLEERTDEDTAGNATRIVAPPMASNTHRLALISLYFIFCRR